MLKSVLAGRDLADLDDAELEAKIGRVLSGANEKRIVDARDNLTAVLGSLA